MNKITNPDRTMLIMNMSKEDKLDLLLDECGDVLVHNFIDDYYFYMSEMYKKDPPKRDCKGKEIKEQLSIF